MGSTYVVSDVHGHLADLREVLGGAGLVDDDDRWTGGDATCGCSATWSTADRTASAWSGSCASLQDQAPDQVRVLMGNHEALMLGYQPVPGHPVRRGVAAQRRPRQGPGGAHRRRRRLAARAARDGPGRRLPADALRHHRLPRLGRRRSTRSTPPSPALLAGDDAAAALRRVRRADQPVRLRRHRRRRRRARECSTRSAASSIVHGHSIIGALVGQPSSRGRPSRCLRRRPGAWPSTAAATTAARCCWSQLD